MKLKIWPENVAKKPILAPEIMNNRAILIFFIPIALNIDISRDLSFTKIINPETILIPVITSRRENIL